MGSKVLCAQEVAKHFGFRNPKIEEAYYQWLVKAGFPDGSIPLTRGSRLEEGKYYPSAANYENNWWLTITEDQVKADMANYKAKADAGEVTAEGVPYKELAYGPEPQSNDAAGATGEETAEESSDAPENAGGRHAADRPTHIGRHEDPTDVAERPKRH